MGDNVFWALYDDGFLTIRSTGPARDYDNYNHAWRASGSKYGTIFPKTIKVADVVTRLRASHSDHLARAGSSGRGRGVTPLRARANRQRACENRNSIKRERHIGKSRRKAASLRSLPCGGGIFCRRSL